MDYTENRFGYLKELSEEERLALIEGLSKEIKEDEEKLEEDGLKGDEIVDTRNDIKFNQEKLDYLTEITPRSK